MNKIAGTKKKGISSSTLKLIAVITMLTDHVGGVILEPLMLQGGTHSGFAGYDPVLYEVDMILRLVIGRMAFPIFCFLLVEGYQRSSNVYQYARRLFAFALLSEFAFDRALSDFWLESSYQNVMFTLFIGLLVMILSGKIEKLQTSRFVTILADLVILVLGMKLADWLQTDYGGYGVMCIAVLYYFRHDRRLQILAGTVAFVAGDYLLNGSTSELLAPLGFLPVAFYNGERGLKLKYLFYIFYPLHLLILYGIRVMIMS